MSALPLKERKKIARAKYRELNPEKDRLARKAAKARWIAKNPERHRANTRRTVARWREKFPEVQKARRRAWYGKNKLSVRSKQLQQKFGLTLEQWEAKFEAQGRVCGCCGSDSPHSTKGWQTDHCHETGKVRDILCRRCNTILAKYLKAELLRKIKAYLLRHGSFYA